MACLLEAGRAQDHLLPSLHKSQQSKVAAAKHAPLAKGVSQSKLLVCAAPAAYMQFGLTCSLLHTFSPHVTRQSVMLCCEMALLVHKAAVKGLHPVFEGFLLQVMTRNPDS